MERGMLMVGWVWVLEVGLLVDVWMGPEMLAQRVELWMCVPLPRLLEDIGPSD